MDIETTGFSAETCSIYLIGCAERRDDRLILRQFFAETPDHEAEILAAFSDYIADKKAVISFNGHRFDLPFLATRAKRHRLSLSLDDLASIDLYRIARKYKSLLQLSSCKQKAIERALHIDREDRCSGGELIEVYRDYGRMGSQEGESLLALHNHDDVFGMYPLLSLLSYEKLKEAHVVLTDLQSDGRDLLLTAELDLSLPIPARVRSAALNMLMDQDLLRALIPLRRASMRYELDHPENYYYLPEEDIVIPKALGESIASSRRRRATPKICCVKKDGVFFPLADFLPKPGDLPLFYETYRGRQAYLEYPDKREKEFMQRYLESILRSIENYRWK